MNAHELKVMFRRREILKRIRDDFNGTVDSQKEITIAMCGYKAHRGILRDLDWLVKHGYLTLTRTWNNWSKSFTLTEKFT